MLPDTEDRTIVFAIRLDKTLERVEHTDRQTNGQTDLP